MLRRHGGLLRRTFLVSGLTLASRILGFAREMLQAALFGDKSAIFDAFITAYRVPNLFRQFLGEGALSTALQTRLTEVDADHGDEAGRVLFWRTLSLVGRILLLLSGATMLLVLYIPDRMPILGWEWLGSDPGPVRELIVRMFPFVILVCLSALIGGALNVRGHFASTAFAPVALNAVWLAAIGYVVWRFGWGKEAPRDLAGQLEMARVLAWGVLAAGVAQLLVQVAPLARFGLLQASRDAQVVTVDQAQMRRTAWDVLRRSAPLAFGASVFQVNVLVAGLMAEGLLPNGGPTVHYLANRIQQFPMALIAVAAISAVFPSLKALGHAGRKEELRQLHDRTQLAVVFLALPATVGLFVLAEPISSVLFGRGAFGQEGVQRVAAAVRMLALALLPAGAVGLSSRAYYARGDFMTPVRVSVAMLLTNTVLSVVFVAGCGMDADGLALATAISSWGNLFLLLPGLHRRLDLPACSLPWKRRLLQVGAASAASGATSFATYHVSATIAGAPIALAISIAVGAAMHIGASAALGIPELGDLRSRLGA